MSKPKDNNTLVQAQAFLANNDYEKALDCLAVVFREQAMWDRPNDDNAIITAQALEALADRWRTVS